VRTSRRCFCRQALAGTGALALTPLGCGRTHRPPPELAGKKIPPPRRRPGRKTRAPTFAPAYLALERTGELARRERELWQLLASCRCCPRRCGANRLAGETGRCSSTARLKVNSAGPHTGEERPLVGEGGSGTIFFSNCNLLCCFCQNWEINHRGDGRFRSHAELAGMMLDLQRIGCHNINLVTPTHVVPHIVKALRIAIGKGLRLPLVYNTGGYDSLEVIQKLNGIVDIYLPDFKYMDGRLAAKYSAGASDYPRVAAAVIEQMHRQVGELRVDKRGIATRGLMIRHLVLPHNIAGTDRFVRWVAKTLSKTTYVNIMSQYHPAHEAFDHPRLARRLTHAEWVQAKAWAREAGLKRLDPG
jgi:putative pyruvate formate lyase activating enzyme